MALRLLLVGRRLGALKAAKSLGAEVYLIDDRPSSSVVRALVAGHAQAPLEDGMSLWAVARRLVGGAPDAVVALTERAVMPAAALRRAFRMEGAWPEDARLWRDKLRMKERVRAAGILTAEPKAVNRRSSSHALVDRLGLPLVLKPRASQGGRGAVFVRSTDEVRGALANGFMAEGFVHGAELSVESLVSRGEVRFENITEYLRPGWANIVPAALPPAVDAAVRRLNREALAALGVEDGITHLEAFVSGDPEAPEVVFGELACRPPGGMIMELIGDAYGFDPWGAHLEVALGRAVTPPAKARVSSGVFFLHPGEGQVRAIGGLDAARAVPGIREVRCRARPGDTVGPRLGTGEFKGCILARTDSRDQTADALEAAFALIDFQMSPPARAANQA